MIPWSFADYQTRGREGEARVPGAVLRYRLAGDAAAQKVVVFESGWTAPFPYAVWLEQALAPHVRVLSYDRAGVGDSRGSAPPTLAGMTQQLTALLADLGIREPVVVAGHSYGGLIAALHAAQAPEHVQAIVQIDPTPEMGDELTDGAMRSLPLFARILQLCALLRIDGPLFLDLARELPPEIFRRMKRDPAWVVRSLNGAIAEIRLLDEIRRVVNASAPAQACRRLVVSSTYTAPVTRLQRLLVNDGKARRYWDAVHGQHRRQGSMNGASRWLRLPYGHVSLVSNRAGAAEVASYVLTLLRKCPRGAVQSR